MAERYLRVRVLQERATTVYLRVDDALTRIHPLPLCGANRVAETGRIIEQAAAAMEALPPAWENVVSVHTVDAITEAEARSCGIVYDGETGRVTHGE